MPANPEHPPLVATQIAAAAILREARCLAGGTDSFVSKANPITPDNIRQAVDTYHQILDAIRDRELA